MIDRQLALQAERSVLGGMMLGGAERASQVLKGEDFCEYRHQLMFDHIVELWAAGLDIGPTSVLKRMSDRGQLTRPETATYLSSMLEVAAIPAQIGHYAQIVREEAERRWQAMLADKMARTAGIDDPAARRAALAEVVAEAEAGIRRADVDQPEAPLYGDVAALLAGGVPPPLAPALLRRDDGNCLLYAGKVNVLFGDPECGKTWIALAAVVDAMNTGGRAAFIDLDHNGMAEVVSRLLLLGARPEHLADLSRFRYVEPEDGDQLLVIVADLRRWRPTIAVVDSIGEVLPILGLSSNSPDDYTSANRRVMTPLATAGAAVVCIDHLPKDEAAREKGQTGTLAKRRTVNGITLRVTVAEPFAPGHGGAASMTVTKDRPGGVRAHCPMVGKSQPAGRFVMEVYPDGATGWHVTAPRDLPVDASDDDVAELDGLAPPPRSQRDVQKRLGWGGTRALSALNAWRDLRKADEA